MKNATHLIVFLSLLAAWVYTRDAWLIGALVGAGGALGIERAPSAKA